MPTTNRLTEELVVGGYAVVATLCGAVFAGVQLTSGPYIGGAFLVIGAFWLCVVASVAAAVVVLIENADRRRRNESVDPWASVFAGLMLVALVAALYLAFAANRLQMAMVVGAVGLVLAPLGLLAAVFEDRLSEKRI
jgi:cadmium resistance protein CadD (predicted permease)